MVKYVAKCDTVYKFKFYRAGDTLEEVDGFDNGNFARADGKPVEKASATVNNTENKLIIPKITTAITITPPQKR